MVSTTLINFGDAVEMVLPAVITQPVSCDLGISTEEEHWAAVILYVSIAFMSVISIPLSNKIGRKALLLSALYLGIIVTVICSAASNYLFLIISRFLLGVSIALNLATTGVYMAEISPSWEFYTNSITLISTAYSLGGGWCGLLGYLLIDTFGWRCFILLTSLPIHIPALILLQFFLPESRGNALYKDPKGEASTLVEQMRSVRSVISRVLKLSTYIMAFIGYYAGDILLIPVIMRDINEAYDAKSPCSAIHGAQFLVITGIFGGCHIVGRLLSYLLQNRVSSTVILIILSFACLPFTAICCIFPHNTTMVFACLAFIQVLASAASNEIYIQMSNKEFFGDKYIAAAAGFLTSAIQVATCLTSVISEIMEYKDTLLVHLGCSIMSSLVSLSLLKNDK